MKAISICLFLLSLLITVSQSALAQDKGLVTKEKIIQKLSEPSNDIPVRSIRIVPKKSPESNETSNDTPVISKSIVPKKSPEVTVYIFFKFGSTEIADDFSKKQLDEAGEALSSDDLSKYRFEIAGHTDDVGTDNYNQELSEHRAMAIKQFLNKRYKIADGRLEVKGYGESNPIANNETPEGRAKNRRVVIKRID